MALDDLVETVSSSIPRANRSNVYRTLQNRGMSSVPKEKRDKAKQLKEYEPGFLHIDATYLPKLEGKKRYLFVAIDRATRLLYYKVYERKTAANATAFLEACRFWFPFVITHILTDNGLEFTDRFARGQKQASGNHIFDKVCKETNIEHRLTQPNTPKTNGMVERVNGTIKSATIKATDYANLRELEEDLKQFLLYYNFNRRHGSLQKNIHNPYTKSPYPFSDIAVIHNRFTRICYNFFANDSVQCRGTEGRETDEKNRCRSTFAVHHDA